MAKVSKLKKREVSVHSRAARREEPTTEIAKGAVVESDYKPWLHSTQGGGIQKKQKKKVLTRAQKARQQKGIEKAEQDAEKLEKKIADSKKSANNIKARAADWEDLNATAVAKKNAQRKTGENTKLGESTAADRDGDEVLLDLDTASTVKASEATTPSTAAEGGTAWAPVQVAIEDTIIDEVT